MLYIPLPKREAEYHDIRAGDTVLVEIREVQRRGPEEA